MRAIIDTNGFIAGLLWRGSPHVLLEHARAGTLAVISSATLIAELADVLGRAECAAILSKTSTSLERTIAEVRQLTKNPAIALPAWLRDSPTFVAGLNLLDDGLPSLLPVFAQTWFFVLRKR